MRRIKSILCFIILSLSVFADSNGLKLEFPNIENNVIYKTLIEETVRHGWTIIGELALAVILTLIFLTMNVKMNISAFWKKYTMTKFLVLELFVIVLGVLYWHSLTNLPIAVDYIATPETVIYKYFMK